MMAEIYSTEAKNQANPDHPDLMLKFGELEIDRHTRAVIYNDNRIKITRNEFDLLWHLASNRNRVVQRSELFDKFIGFEYNGVDRKIDLRVSRLRKKLLRIINRDLIKSVRSEGYRFLAKL